MVTPLIGTKDVVGMTDVITGGEMIEEETTTEAATIEEIGIQGVGRETEVIITVSEEMIVVTVTGTGHREVVVTMFVSMGRIAVIDSKVAALGNTWTEVVVDEFTQ